MNAELMWRVKLVPSHDCYVRVPTALARELVGRGSSRVVLRMETDDWRTGGASCLLVSWEGSVSNGEEVELSSSLWGALRADSAVRLEPMEAPPVCGVVCVEPLTSDDWEMLELNAGYLEEQILNQTYVLSLGQEFPLWIYGKQMVRLLVKSLDCGPSGVMRPDTSFVVEPKPRKAMRNAPTVVMKPVVLRVLPALGDEQRGVAAASCEDWTDGAIVCALNPHPPHGKQESVETVARLVLRASRDANVPRGCVRLAAEAMLTLQLLPWARLEVFPTHRGPDGGLKSWQLVVLSRTKMDVVPLWESFIAHSAARVFSHGSLVELVAQPPLFARLLFKEPEGEYVLGQLLKQAERSVVFTPPQLSLESVRPLRPRLAELVGVNEPSQQLAGHILFCGREPTRDGTLAVVAGGIGSGKTGLIRAVCGSVPHLYTEVVDCEQLAVEKLSAVRSVLSDAAVRCQGNFPSCLVLENLHLLCAESDEATLRPQHLSEALTNVLRSTEMVALASLPSAELLHPLVRQLPVRGTTLAVVPLSRSGRRELALRVATELHLGGAEAEFDYVADATDGFSPGDLRALLERIPRDGLSAQSVDEAKKLSTPGNLLGVKLHKSKARFAQIGGLASAKTTLRETFGYPKTHSKLMEVRSGLCICFG
jgi:peroxin-1